MTTPAIAPGVKVGVGFASVRRITGSQPREMGDKAEVSISATRAAEPGKSSPSAEQGQWPSAAPHARGLQQAALIGPAIITAIGMVPVEHRRPCPALDWRKGLGRCVLEAADAETGMHGRILQG